MVRRARCDRGHADPAHGTAARLAQPIALAFELSHHDPVDHRLHHRGEIHVLPRRAGRLVRCAHLFRNGVRIGASRILVVVAVRFSADRWWRCRDRRRPPARSGGVALLHMAAPRVTARPSARDDVRHHAIALRRGRSDRPVGTSGAAAGHCLQYDSRPPSAVAESVEPRASRASDRFGAGPHSGTRIGSAAVPDRSCRMAHPPARPATSSSHRRLLAVAARALAGGAADASGRTIATLDGRIGRCRTCRLLAPPRRALPSWLTGISTDAAHAAVHRVGIRVLPDRRPSGRTGEDATDRDVVCA